jgi:uncharacterized protein YfcZ (UPF0381/DUF406 family)
MSATANPLSVNEPVTPEPQRRLVCEFCGCQLAPSGEVMRLGDDAKRFRDFADQKEKLEKRISEMETDNAELRRKVTALETAPAPTPVTGRSTLFPPST